jgi:hypothetical protein
VSVGIEARCEGGVEQPGQANRRGEEGDATTHKTILARNHAIGACDHNWLLGDV